MRYLTTTLVVLGTMAAAQVAQAVVFPVIGSGASAYYNANVVYRTGSDGNSISSATAQLGPGVSTQSGGPANLIGFGNTGNTYAWSASGMSDSTKYVIGTVALDQTYTLNRIATHYWNLVDTNVGEYQLFGSTDGTHYSQLNARTAIGSTDVVTPFAATPVHYIQWQIWGPGAQPGIDVKVPLTMEAFVAASSAEAPGTNQGYDIAPLASVAASNGFAVWDTPAAGASIDGNFNTLNYSSGAGDAASITYNLGGTYNPDFLKMTLYNGSWINGSIQVAMTLAGLDAPGATVYSGTLANGTTYFLDGRAANYVRINGNWSASGNLVEVGIFELPEPGSAAVLGLGALLALRRRRA